MGAASRCDVHETFGVRQFCVEVDTLVHAVSADIIRHLKSTSRLVAVQIAFQKKQVTFLPIIPAPPAEPLSSALRDARRIDRVKYIAANRQMKDCMLQGKHSAEIARSRLHGRHHGIGTVIE